MLPWLLLISARATLMSHSAITSSAFISALPAKVKAILNCVIRMPAMAGPRKVAEPNMTELTPMAAAISARGTRLGPMVTRAGTDNVPTMPCTMAKVSKVQILT